MSEFAAELSRQTGESIPYVNLSSDDYRASLVSAGWPEAVVTNLADADRAVADGEMLIDTGDLSRLVGRPLTALSEAIAQALHSLEAATHRDRRDAEVPGSNPGIPNEQR
jgi:NAD(P)H dehydrogenase (quinone)